MIVRPIVRSASWSVTEIFICKAVHVAPEDFLIELEPSSPHSSIQITPEIHPMPSSATAFKLSLHKAQAKGNLRCTFPLLSRHMAAFEWNLAVLCRSDQKLEPDKDLVEYVSYVDARQHE